MCISGIGKGSDGVGSVRSDCTPYRAAIREAERVQWEIRTSRAERETVFETVF
jgi:hypothetical protein